MRAPSNVDTQLYDAYLPVGAVIEIPVYMSFEMAMYAVQRSILKPGSQGR